MKLEFESNMFSKLTNFKISLACSMHFNSVRGGSKDEARMKEKM